MQLADRYAAMLDEDAGRLRERTLLDAPRKLSELEIQARWFAGDFGSRFKTTTGVDVRIVQFGVWNREAGPDFAEAAISFDGAPPIRGCIEIDPDARDWERHGHAANPDYETVALHVFLHRGEAEFFTRSASNREIPQVLLDLSKLDEGAANITPIAKLGRCMAPLRELAREKINDVLDAAAQFRLQKKAVRLAQLAEIHGADEALYQSLAETLGYKWNKLPFTLLAQRLPLRFLLQNIRDVDALLFGVSGFLGTTDLAKFDGETRSYLRGLWENWWTRRAEFERFVLAKTEWRMSGARPANHPQRRIAALAQLVKKWPKVRALSRVCSARDIEKFFVGLHDEYWDFHYTVTSRKSATHMALVGESRVTEMLVNVFFPMAILADSGLWNAYRKVPAVLSNRRVEIAAIRLLGDNPLRNELMKTAAHQQGLLQIYEDFCMHDNSDCAQCRFPKQIAQWG